MFAHARIVTWCSTHAKCPHWRKRVAGRFTGVRFHSAIVNNVIWRVRSTNRIWKITQACFYRRTCFVQLSSILSMLIVGHCHWSGCDCASWSVNWIWAQDMKSSSSSWLHRGDRAKEQVGPPQKYTCKIFFFFSLLFFHSLFLNNQTHCRSLQIRHVSVVLSWLGFYDCGIPIKKKVYIYEIDRYE